MPINRDRVLQLLEIFKASQAGEFALQEGDRYYRFVRAAAAPAVTAAPQHPEAAAAPEPELITIKARVVGLFYRGKQPGQDPLVHVGDKVAEGQPLGIIEVLRKPTVINSSAAGEVTEIFHADGHGVQYGDPLFIIRPA